MPWHTVPSFGGGLNFTAPPAALRDDQWTQCDGFLAKGGCAEPLPGYATFAAANWMPGPPAHTLQGIADNPFTTNALIVGAFEGGGILLLMSRTAGGVTTVVGSSGADVTGDRFRSGFFNNRILAACGNAANWSCLAWDGGATYDRLDAATFATGITAGSLTGCHIIPFANRAVLLQTSTSTAAGLRTIAWSNVASVTLPNAFATWTTNLPSTAGTVALDDAESLIVAAARMSGNAMALFTRTQHYVLAPTGGVVPWTLHYVGPHGAFDQSSPTFGSVSEGLIGETPYGTIVLCTDGFRMAGSAATFGSEVLPYVIAFGGALQRRIEWHPGYGAAILQLFNSSLQKFEQLLFDPVAGTWSRRVTVTPTGVAPVDISQFADQCLMTTTGLTSSNTLHVIASRTTDGSIWRENTPGIYGANYTQAVGSTVDTKDFAFGTPPVRSELQRIMVDWEPLTSGTDALEVWTSSRDGFSVSTTGSPTWQTSPSFTNQGTLNDGAAMLALPRPCGKYHRIRFRVNSGAARIRGFSLYYVLRGDRTP